MTHKTGSRPKVMKKLIAGITGAIEANKATISESLEAMHEVQMRLFKRTIELVEDITCPTCPKDADK